MLLIQSHKNNKAPILTFDQQLYWKALEIVIDDYYRCQREKTALLKM